MADNYGCLFISQFDSPFSEVRGALEGHAEFRVAYDPKGFLDDGRMMNQVFRRREGFTDYDRAVILELRRMKNDAPNVACLVFHGIGAGIAGTVRTLVDCVTERGLLTYFGGSSKTPGVGIIYKPE